MPPELQVRLADLDERISAAVKDAGLPRKRGQRGYKSAMVAAALRAWLPRFEQVVNAGDPVQMMDALAGASDKLLSPF